MNMKDSHSGSSVALLIGAAVLSADNVPTAVDLRGFRSAEILLAIGAGGITFSDTDKIEFVLTHSDDGETWDAVSDADVLGASVASGGIIKALTAAHAAAAAYRVGYVGGRRYLALLADFSGTHGTGTPIAAMLLEGDPTIAPTADQA
ncbi:hypothetical protein A33M_1710 [Rhodovulum sp. PH10]|uniref:hypothetical protein n=1 Tax=Rhodovulum sp. PH10 TaxID=1187851 RepID=UPI00027C24B2|nr:hypothetical protein [Rhodovulum sp. PH10]EJW12740.1 hypothetical protein A33M_1710 [Rhodovulum sp. PH10]